MIRRSALSLAVVFGAVALTSGCASAPADKGHAASEPPPAAAKPMPSPEEMQKMMVEMATPAAQHRELAAQAGVWDADVTMWMEPGKEPVRTKGVSIRRAVLGGKFVLDEYKSDFLGQPFEGVGMHGYSKERGQYVGFWGDSMGTTPEVMWGTADATGKVITMDGDKYMCSMGGFLPRWVIRNVDADHMTFEHWSKMDGAPDYTKEVEVKYTRRK